MGATSGQIALAWLLAQKPWIVSIPSSPRIEQLKVNVLSVEVELTPDCLAQFAQPLSAIPVQGNRLPEAVLSLRTKQAGQAVPRSVPAARLDPACHLWPAGRKLRGMSAVVVVLVSVGDCRG